MTERFRIELDGAPWVYSTARTPLDAQREAWRMLEFYDARTVHVHDLRHNRTRTFERHGRRMLEVIKP